MNYNNSQQKPIVELVNIYKSFNSNMVLKGVNLSLFSGDILAIVGGNGAGKSTLMKILTGLYLPDKGNIILNGDRVVFNNPADAHKNGIYLIPQEPMLFPNMTVEENILIGFKSNKKELKKKLVTLMDRLGWNIDLNRIAETLSIAEQQLIEILRGLLREVRILILDEPTSSLTFNEIKSLFKVIEDLRRQGIGIFYITHRLTEVFEIATHVIILRDGVVTLSGRVEEFTKEMLIQGLLPSNNTINENKMNMHIYSRIDRKNLKPILEIKNLSGYGFRNINMEVYPGEVLGIAGVVGAGRTELAEAIFSIGEIISGNVYLNGENITGLKTKEIIKRGLNYVSEDRHLNGIFDIANVQMNITSAALTWISKFYLNIKKEKEISEKYINELRIKVSGHEQILKSLSGGNQQKVVIGRALSTMPNIIILDEPTRGIDASTRADLYKIILELKNQGHAILLISSDLEEIIELCDRVEIMYQGTICQRYEYEEITLDNLMAASFGLNNKKGGKV